MKKKTFKRTLCILMTAALLTGIPVLAAEVSGAGIVVYGGGFPGVAAAAKAARLSPKTLVTMIVPDPVSQLGDVGTTGGQNFFDRRRWKGTDPCRGSFAWWSSGGQFYQVDTMAARLAADLSQYPNLRVLYGCDICGVTFSGIPARIDELQLKNVIRSTDGSVEWGGFCQSVSGSVFVDASADGRLVRALPFTGSVGRGDWPADKLDADERGAGQSRQQAATLLFKVTGVHCGEQNKYGDMDWTQTEQGIWGVSGGRVAFANDPAIISFNETYGPRGFALKPLNAAQDGAGSGEWWVNALLVFNVDGRARNRDRGTDFFPKDIRADYKTVDDAWVQARALLKNTPMLLSALQRLGGFENARLVLDADGEPVVGQTLYLRETVHLASAGSGSENERFALTTVACNKAGTKPGTGADAGNYDTRIGLAYYWSDINAYKFGDLKSAFGTYIWGGAVGQKLRPELGITDKTPENPVYIPYRCLTDPAVSNLLVPGYAASASSFAWAELRTLPNLCVLGDAAGVSAAYAVNHGVAPLHFTKNDIAGVRDALVKYCGARVEK